jgi:hypothetical protein
VGRGRTPGEASRPGGLGGGRGGWVRCAPPPEGEGRSPAHRRRGRGHPCFRNLATPRGAGRGDWPPAGMGCGALSALPHSAPNSCGGANWPAAPPSGRRGPSLPSPTIRRSGGRGKLGLFAAGVGFPGRVGSPSLASWSVMGWSVGLGVGKRPQFQGRERRF